MIESVLTKKRVSFITKIKVKTLVSAAVIAFAIVLPQIIHAIAGPSGGAQWLPMYLPVLLGGCLLGWKWGLAVGVISPALSFCVTYAFGNPMPVLERLPYMVAELAVFGAVSGAFSSKIIKNEAWSFPAVLCAEIAGRSVFLVSYTVFGSFSAAYSQIRTGFIAIVLQTLLVPAIVVLITLAIKKQNR